MDKEFDEKLNDTNYNLENATDEIKELTEFKEKMAVDVDENKKEA